MDKKEKEQIKKARKKAYDKAKKKEKSLDEFNRRKNSKKTEKKSSKSEKMQYMDSIRKEKNSIELKKKRKKKKAFSALVIVVAIAVIAAIPFGVYAVIKNTKIFEKKVYAAESNDFKISDAQMSYFFTENYKTFLKNYSDYLDSYGIDPDVSPKEQYYDESSGTTLFEYIMTNSIEPYVEQLLTLNEGAKSENVTLSDEETEDAKNTLAELDITDYGENATEDEILQAIEMGLLAQKYYSQLRDSFEYTDDEINSYLEENIQDFLTCDYKYITFSYSDDDSDDSDDSTLTDEQAYEYAESVSKCKNESEFDAWVADYMRESDPDTTDEAVDAQLANMTVTGYECSTDDDLSDWLCDSTTEVNDIKVFSDDGSYTVYMLLSEPTKNETPTVNVRLMYFNPYSYDDAEAKAEEVYEDWNNSDKTEDYFEDLCMTYSSDSDLSINGGLYSNITEGYFITDLDEWVYDDSRKAGDTEIFNLSRGSYILYYVGEGIETWRADVDDTMRTADYSDVYNRYLEGNPVTFSEDYENIVVNID